MAEIRYHLDEHMDTAIAVGLRRRGINVTTTADAGLIQSSDVDQLAFAIAERRALVTRDRAIHTAASKFTNHAGIVIAKSGRKLIGPTVLALAGLHRAHTAEEMVNRIEYL
jgi:hypothetical protein